jgi:hypothetical protein
MKRKADREYPGSTLDEIVSHCQHERPVFNDVEDDISPSHVDIP